VLQYLKLSDSDFREKYFNEILGVDYVIAFFVAITLSLLFRQSLSTILVLTLKECLEFLTSPDDAIV